MYEFFCFGDFWRIEYSMDSVAYLRLESDNVWQFDCLLTKILKH